MICVVPFRLEHLARLDVQDYQRPDRDRLLELPQRHVLEDMSSYTIVDGDEPFICGGVMEMAPWRGLAWCYLAKDLGTKMVLAHRVAKRLVDAVPYDRVEFEIRSEHEEGHRWVQLLGFELETACVRKYRYDGGDIARYVRIR